MKLNEKGQCPPCKKKPIKYKSYWSTSDGPHYFCSRCKRAYDIDTEDQFENWAWVFDGDDFIKRQGVL